MKKKYVVVLGAGVSGIGSAILAKKKGYDVFVSDINKIKKEEKKILINHSINYEECHHSLFNQNNTDFVIKSPGISNQSDLIKKIKSKKINIISEIEFASRYTNSIIIGVTGSNGKTTTTILIYEILKKAGFSVEIAGNIGNSFAKLVADKKFDYCVLELSSFQLDDIVEFSPEYAIITNITKDHLDRYNNNFDDYIKSKLRITINQSNKDYLIFNSDDPSLKKMINSKLTKANLHSFSINDFFSKTQIKDSEIIINTLNKKNMVNTIGFQLIGRHNLLNAMAASTVASLLNISNKKIRDSLVHFKGAPHRMEPVLKIQKVQYINDSKATNVNATYFALESIETSVIWIVGGVDKGNDYSSLLPLVRKKVKGIICLGLDNKKIINVFGPFCENIIETTSIIEAVKIGSKLSSPNETVLLSPSCASFDLFKNYEDRGNKFKSAVRNL
ncbi:MAG: UDP-N-acetylmuramoyl-L-alanine--D-glutamate ligase [Flavobacteriaceae bacterium]|nr:UDP-N-acetylmuramoyl-L-alanine--D-glutamate ligase [Flavobacteriaceae bacterium]|tara:strand:- start:22196 stop:23533 length:1338 start_codon:yes stop_codon:yes gene_type:complete